MLTVFAGLSAAFAYALHDFLMVKVVRAAAVVTALTWSVGVGLLVLMPLALVLTGVPHGAAEWRAVGFAMASGVCEAAALGCLLRGLVVGRLSIVTPLASLAGGFVAAVAVLAGEPLSLVAMVGLPLAVAGGLMASIEAAPKEEVFGPVPEAAALAGPSTAALPEPARRSWATAGAGWALLSSALFSVTVLLINAARVLDPVALAASARLGTMIVLVPVAVLLAGLRLPRVLVRRTVAAGLLDAAAFVAVATAISLGPLAVAAVTVAQAATVAALLGLVFLRERLSRLQYVGVALACVAVVLLAAG